MSNDYAAEAEAEAEANQYLDDSDGAGDGDDDELGNDPFDFSNIRDQPDMVSEIDWTDLYKWAPTLKQAIDEKTGKPYFLGRMSDIAQAIIHHNGKPLNLSNHAFMLPIYNYGDNDIVMKCGRQVAKTTTVAILQAIESIIRPFWKSLYVSPSTMQTRQYSNEKLRPTLHNSPFIKNYFLGKDCIDQVYEQTLTNGSYMFLRYAYLTAARARGIPASRVFFDETQDLISDNVKIISQSLSASRVSTGVTGRTLITGTPLTFSNTLEQYWGWSTQNEWLVPCDCKAPRFWNLLGVANIGKKGLICANCGKPIDPTKGQWISYAPGELYQGYRITQLMVPWMQKEEDWKKDILFPLEKWPESKLQNEIIGNSFDNATNPINKIDLVKCCYPQQQVSGVDTSRYLDQRAPAHSGVITFAGIDWGEGRSDADASLGKKRFASWTVLTIGGYLNPNLYWIFFQKRYEGKEIDPESIVPDVLNWCGRFNVHCIGVDWGHGWGVNSKLMKHYGKNRVMQFNYSDNLGERKKWDREAYKWIINRNAVITDFVDTIRSHQLVLPAWEQFESFGKDMLAEYVEFNERTHRMRYDHPIDQPDDALHSSIYSKLTADIVMKRF